MKAAAWQKSSSKMEGFDGKPIGASKHTLEDVGKYHAG
jgi:hypothetical protein